MAGVYISYPFCAQKCAYCNFASGVFSQDLERRYAAVLKERISQERWEWIPETVYLGGGTPSRMAFEELAEILKRIPGAPWREATLEAAPGTLDRERIEHWAASGINRVSLGVQSFVQTEIARTGRRHTAAVVDAETRLLRECGIGNFNIDLIAGLAGQTRESWRESLDWIERIAPPHVSIYIFEVDEDSRLGREMLLGGVRYGASDVPEEGLVVELYETAVERLASLGIPRYEISNFARPGFESLHNLKYWKREPYVGFGADAHGFDGRLRHRNVETPQEYVDGVAAPESEAAIADEERLFLGLRLTEGVVLAPQDLHHGPAIERFVHDGLLEHAGERIRLTPRGVLLSNEVFQEFVA